MKVENIMPNETRFDFRGIIKMVADAETEEVFGGHDGRQ